MLDPKTLKKNIISDMRVELAEEFDKNFTRKAFFTEWGFTKSKKQLSRRLRTVA